VTGFFSSSWFDFCVISLTFWDSLLFFCPGLSSYFFRIEDKICYRLLARIRKVRYFSIQFWEI
jgi:hypothetical protein